MRLRFEGPIWYWRGPAPYHFVTVPPVEAAAIAEVAHRHELVSEQIRPKERDDAVQVIDALDRFVLFQTFQERNKGRSTLVPPVFLYRVHIDDRIGDRTICT